MVELYLWTEHVTFSLNAFPGDTNPTSKTATIIKYKTNNQNLAAVAFTITPGSGSFPDVTNNCNSQTFQGSQFLHFGNNPAPTGVPTTADIYGTAGNLWGLCSGNSGSNSITLAGTTGLLSVTNGTNVLAYLYDDHFTIASITSASNSSAVSYGVQGWSMVIGDPDAGGDTTAPIISQVTAIPTLSNNTTPSYTFTTDEAGTLTTDIAEGFTEGTSVTITGTGNQTVTFATLPEGTYTGKTITLTDAANNASTALIMSDFTIDITNPVITLNGSATITLNEGDTYTDAGATATDNPGSVNLTASITTTGTVNPDVAGTYTLTYNVNDAAGNTATPITRTVTVTADTTSPIILEITAIPTLSNNTTPSYTFTTDEAGTLTTDIAEGFAEGTSVTITGTGNQTVTFATLPEGTYTGKTITLTDADGNVSTPLTIPTFTIDFTKPIITLNGSASITLNEGDTYTDAGATATDNPGSVDLTASITTTGTVNPDVAGTYTLTYNVNDAAGNTAIAVTRTVTVTALDDKIYFWTEYNDASNNTAIYYGIYNTTKISGVQFTYDVSGATTVENVSYSIVDNTNNNTMIHKKDWPIHIINNRTNTSTTADDGVANKAMVFAGSVNQTINGMNTGVFAIVQGNVTLASIVAVVDENSNLLATDQYALGEPANPPEITEPGGRKLGDINFDGSLNSIDTDIMRAYLLNDTDSSFNVYGGDSTVLHTGKTAIEIIGTIDTDGKIVTQGLMSDYDILTYIDVNNNNILDVGDLVRMLSKRADPAFSMTNGTN